MIQLAKRLTICLVVGVCLNIASASAQLRIVTYNTATSGENGAPALPRPAVAQVLEGIGAEVVNGVARPIDVLLLQEQAAVNTTTQAIVELLNEIYGEEKYGRGRLSGASNGGGRAGIVYNTRTVELLQERSFGRLSGEAQARQTLRYQVRPIGYDERSDLFLFVNHYKSGSSATDKSRRNVEAKALRVNADRLGPSVHAVYAGDFNITNCNEAMFQSLTAPGEAQAIDPMAEFGNGCSWKDNSGFRRLHTQSPAATSATGLVRGGVDDRFDFQLVTQNLFDGEGLSLIPESYHAFGNNGTHTLNGPINDSKNTALPGAMLHALAHASDHLPVVADYQLPAIMEVTPHALPERVLLGSELSLGVTLANSAPVASPTGADELDFHLEFGAQGFPVVRQLGHVLAGRSEEMDLPLPTHSVGEFTYGVNIRSDSQGAMSPFFTSGGAYSVVAPSVGSLLNSAPVSNDAVSVIVALGNTLELPFRIHNIGTPNGAGLDLLSVDWKAANGWEADLDVFTNLPAGESHPFSIRYTADHLGVFEDRLRLGISDDRGLFGARSDTLSIDIALRVALASDANLDGKVGFEDFLTLSGGFGGFETTWAQGDFNHDQRTDFTDFLLLSGNFGQPSASRIVPEPRGGATGRLLLLLLAMMRLKIGRHRNVG